jgi:hypothetical protein
MVGTLPGSATRPRSMASASSCAKQTPTRSPRRASVTGRRNICMDLTFLVCFSAGSSTACPTTTRPCSTVPVSTVPWPRMQKQWSTANSSGGGGTGSGAGSRTRASTAATSASTPCAGAPALAAAARARRRAA